MRYVFYKCAGAHLRYGSHSVPLNVYVQQIMLLPNQLTQFPLSLPPTSQNTSVIFTLILSSHHLAFPSGSIWSNLLHRHFLTIACFQHRNPEKERNSSLFMFIKIQRRDNKNKQKKHSKEIQRNLIVNKLGVTWRGLKIVSYSKGRAYKHNFWTELLFHKYIGTELRKA